MGCIRKMKVDKNRRVAQMRSICPPYLLVCMSFCDACRWGYSLEACAMGGSEQVI